MRWHPHGYGGQRRDPDQVKREGWHEQGVLAVSADDQRRAYRIADNKLTELGTWDEALRYAKSTKPWAVAGLQLPSTIYMRHMRNAFGQSCEWLKRHIATLSQQDRLSLEKRFSDIFVASAIGGQCKAWREAIDARS